MLGLLNSADLIGKIREISDEDVERYEKLGPGKAVRDFKVARDKHHRIAQLFALGTKSGEIAARMDMSPTTISTLRAAPAMAALVEQYRAEAFTHDLGVTGKIEEVAIDGLRAIHARIMCDGMEDKDLINVTTALFDRTGRGPTKKVEHRGVNLTGADLLALKAAAREADNFRPVVGQRVLELAPLPKDEGSEGQGYGLRAEDDQAYQEDVSELSSSGEPVD